MNVNIGKIENSRIYFEENDGRRRQIPVPAELPMQSNTPAQEESPACQKSVLLFVITGVELKALLLALEKSGKKTISAEKGNLRYIKTKGFAGTVYICQSQMGAVGPASVMNTLALALEALQPAWVIMCGIACREKRTAKSAREPMHREKNWSMTRISGKPCFRRSRN